MSTTDSITHWISTNKLRSIGTLWVTSVAGSLAYQWSQPIPNSLKILHSRVYAQAITLGALGLVAAVDIYDHRDKSTTLSTQMSARIEELERKLGMIGGEDSSKK